MTIHQEISIQSTPSDVYRVLTTSSGFSDFSGAPADIDSKEGGRIGMFGGRITGLNIELKPNRRVVQAWRAETWDEGVFSIVRIDLVGATDGTRITFQHTGYPDDERDHLSEGWHRMYWDPLKALLDDRKASASGEEPPGKSS